MFGSNRATCNRGATVLRRAAVAGTGVWGRLICGHKWPRWTRGAPGGYFEEAEWKALLCFLNWTPTPPLAPPSLREAIHMVAGLRGFLGRKLDGEP